MRHVGVAQPRQRFDSQGRARTTHALQDRLSRLTVSHHRNLLCRAGLVRVRKQGREMSYRLNKEPIVATLQGLLDRPTCC